MVARWFIVCSIENQFKSFVLLFQVAAFFEVLFQMHDLQEVSNDVTEFYVFWPSTLGFN